MGEKTWPFTGYCFHEQRNIKIYCKTKKNQSEGTCYQGHMDKKKLKIALRERKYIHANKPACGLRVWKKATCSLNKDASLWFLLSLGKMRPLQNQKKNQKSICLFNHMFYTLIIFSCIKRSIGPTFLSDSCLSNTGNLPNIQ